MIIGVDLQPLVPPVSLSAAGPASSELLLGSKKGGSMLMALDKGRVGAVCGRKDVVLWEIGFKSTSHVGIFG